MDILLVFEFLLLLFLKRRISNTFLNEFFWLMGPYSIIILINNRIMHNLLGFYLVSDKAIVLLMIGFVSFFMGTLMFQRKSSRDTVLKDDIKFNYVSMTKYISLILLLRTIDLLYLYLSGGMENLIKDDFYSLQLNGVFAHLFLSVQPLIPIIFYKGITTKNKMYIMITCWAVLCAFSSFIKYDVISLVLMIFLYLVLNNKKYLKKAGGIVFAIIILAFFGNYLLNFFLKGFTITIESFKSLFNHFWIYLSGGIINLNLIFESNFNFSIINYLIKIIFPLPNMFLSKVGFSIVGSYSSSLDSFPLISIQGSSSNVICVFGYLAGSANYAIFIIFSFIWGLLCSFVCNILPRIKKGVFNMVVVTFLAFNILSFFGNYWGLVGPWEVLLYSFFMPYLFSDKVKIKFLK